MGDSDGSPTTLLNLATTWQLPQRDPIPTLVACQRIIFGWAVAELVKSFERQWLNVWVLV
jgi:hypothetical protein